MKKLFIILLALACLWGCATTDLTDTARRPIQASEWKLVGGVLQPANGSWSLAAGLAVTSDGDGIILTSLDWGKMIWMTGAGEVQLPDAGASDIGKYIIVGNRDNAEQVEVVLTDGTEQIVGTDGTAYTAGNEADMSTLPSSRTVFVYMETGKWFAFGTPTSDGGAAD